MKYNHWPRGSSDPDAGQEFDHSFAQIKNGILFWTFKDGVIINQQTAAIIVANLKAVTNSIAMPMLADITGLSDVVKTGREYLASPDAINCISAVAFYTRRNSHWIAGNMIIMFDNPGIPAETFIDREKALDWLNRTRRGAG